MQLVYFIKIGVIMAFLSLLPGCLNPDLKSYHDQQPALDIKQYFDGSIKAWGIVQDWRGKVIRRFEADLNGSWEGDKGVLKETFTFDDGEIDHRTWLITKTSDSEYSGTAGDILGSADGQQSGNAVRWRYQMNLKVGDSTYRIDFDDWMWLMNDDVLINRSYMKKWGVTVGELTLFMQKKN